MNEDLFHKLLIFRTKGIGAVKYQELIRDFGGPEQAMESLAITGDQIDDLRREIDLAVSLGVKYIDDESPSFPKIYKIAKNHSPVISVRGNIDTLNKKTVGIVGTRHATGNGMNFITSLASSFAKNNYAVVSGMAMGVDTAAHIGALKENGNSQTIAVLAGGVDYIWPLENEKLYYEIIERGCIVSDMPVGFKPVANNFIARNRIVSGLSEQLILGEADEKSGSVATANFTIELNRPLWAVPGFPTDERSVGPNGFISKGLAKLCQGADDFFGSNDKREEKNKKEIPQSCLFDLIGSSPVSESVLTDLSKKNISEVMSELVILELQGFIKKTSGGYIRA